MELSTAFSPPTLTRDETGTLFGGLALYIASFGCLIGINVAVQRSERMAISASAAQNEERKNRRLPMPVLGIGGEESGGENAANVMKLVADDVHADLLPGSSHWVAEQAPEALLVALTEFLAPYRERSTAASHAGAAH